MEFGRRKQFTSEDLQVKKNKSVSYKPTGKSIQITCANFDYDNQIINCGLSNGSVLQFVRKGFDTKFLIEKKKDYEIETYDHLKGIHKGEIKCLLYERIFNSVYIITGSVDRTIKLWDTDKKKKAIVQTLVGHNGTIMALAFSRNMQTLFSASTDKVFRIWKQEKDRNMLYHPWFVQYQAMADFSMKKVVNNNVFITTIYVRREGRDQKERESDLPEIYTGDTEGNVHIIKPESNKINANFVLKTNPNYHRLHVIQILYVSKDNEMYSIGYDQKILGYQESQKKVFINIKNPYKCLYTSLTWNPDNQELIAGDEQGRIYFINAHTDKSVQEFKLYDTKIIKLEYLQEDEKNILFVYTQNFIDVLVIKRGVKAGSLQDQHTAPILGLYGLMPLKLTKGHYKESPSLISSSLDGTLRVWDPKDMTCQNVLQNPDKDEFSAFYYLNESNLFVSGHNSGNIRFWNIELNNSLKLDQKGQYQHTDSVICFISYIVIPEKKGLQQEEKSEFLVSSGFDSRLNFWEIFEKKSTVGNMTSSIICPQLKHTAFAIPYGQDKPHNRGDEILCLAVNNISNEVKHILAAGNRGYIYVISNEDYEQEYSLSRHKDSVNCMVVEEKILFSGSNDFHICLWDLLSYSHLSSIKAHEYPIRDLMIVEETGHLISCAYDGKIKIWDYTQRDCIKEFQKKNEGIRCLGYVLDEKEVEEEIEDEYGETDIVKKMKKDLKLFVGTDENNIHCFQIEEFLQENKRIELVDIDDIKARYEEQAEQFDIDDQNEQDSYDDQEEYKNQELDLNKNQSYLSNSKYKRDNSGISKQNSQMLKRETSSKNPTKLTDKNINSILENQNKLLEELNQ